jgi:hypothetical protein
VFSNLKRYEVFLPATAPASLGDLPHELRIYGDSKIEIWFSPMGLGVTNPEIWILGITPGWNQMRIAYEGAAAALEHGSSPAEASAKMKPNVAFAGTMRNNLVAMMDELGFPEVFGISTSADLFGSELLRTGSVLKYPVFNGSQNNTQNDTRNSTRNYIQNYIRNYNGHTPNPIKHPALRQMIDTVLAGELKSIGRCLILPLGKAVESVLQYSVSRGLVNDDQILSGFPHPSGANGHRKKQFEQHRERLQSEVRKWYRRAP